MPDDPTQVNTVRYPGTPTNPQYDTVDNWPATTQVTQNTGEDITRNRDALLIIERLLGPNPHIGLFTTDIRTTSVAQRLSILEQGVAEGRFEFKRLKVERAIETVKDVNEAITLVLGAARTAASEYTQIEVRGPLRVYNSNASDPRARFDVGFIVEKALEDKTSTECEIRGSSTKNKPLLLIEDFNRSEINDQDHRALEIRGNLFVSGYIDGKFALDHNRLNNIQTDPVVGAQGIILQSAIHVSRGNYHSHKRGRYDPDLGRWLVDSNPQASTYGIIDHSDLEPQSTRTSIRQRNFLPDPNVAYHVTNGDDHDHVGGDGAPLRHKFLLGVNPKNSNHVTNGDFHRHDPNVEDGGLIPTHGVVLQESLEASLQSLSLNTTGDPVAAGENLSLVLTRIANRFTANDEKNAEQDERLDIQRSELEEAKLARQEFNQVRASVSSVLQDVSTLEGNVSTIENQVNTNTSNLAALKDDVAAGLFTTTLNELSVGSKVYVVGGGGGSSGSLTAFTAKIGYKDHNGTTDVSRTTTDIQSFSGSVTTGLATTPQLGSIIVPRAGVLKGFYARASEDLPAGVEIAITLYKNFIPSTLSVTLIKQDTIDIPEVVGESTGEVELEIGDFLTFEVFNRGSVDLSGIAISAGVNYRAPNSS